MKKKNKIIIFAAIFIIFISLMAVAQEIEFLATFIPTPEARYVTLKARQFYNSADFDPSVRLPGDNPAPAPASGGPTATNPRYFDICGKSIVNRLYARFLATPIVRGVENSQDGNDGRPNPNPPFNEFYQLNLSSTSMSRLPNLQIGGNIASNLRADRPARLSVRQAIRMRAGGTGLGMDGKNIRDIAEAIKLRECTAGDLVIIDPDFNNSVTTTVSPYDTRVAGVVSEKPDFLLGKAENGEGYLCLAGKVYCNATAINGAIKPGDMLTSSPKKGFAMRADIDKLKAGMIIGKALEGLDSGEAKILILVNQS